MDKPEENISCHRPEWDEDGIQHYKITPHHKSEKCRDILLKGPGKVIPVIFIPDILGSNLKNSDDEVWQSSENSLSKWLFANQQKRKTTKYSTC